MNDFVIEYIIWMCLCRWLQCVAGAVVVTFIMAQTCPVPSTRVYANINANAPSFCIYFMQSLSGSWLSLGDPIILLLSLIHIFNHWIVSNIIWSCRCVCARVFSILYSFISFIVFCVGRKKKLHIIRINDRWYYVHINHVICHKITISIFLFFCISNAKWMKKTNKTNKYKTQLYMAFIVVTRMKWTGHQWSIV